MNDRRRKFAENYISCGDAKKAAIAAGYNEKNARQVGYNLLKVQEVKDYIDKENKLISSANIATAEEIQAFWTSIFMSEEERTTDRLKASELLAKVKGLFEW